MAKLSLVPTVPLLGAVIYTPTARMNAKSAKYTEVRFTDNFPLKHAAWRTQCPLLIFLLRVPLTASMPLSVQISMVSKVPCFTACYHFHLTDALYLAFVHVLDDLERFAKESSDPATLTSVQEARQGLEKLISKLDTLEPGFDRIAERSCKFFRVSLCHLVVLCSFRVFLRTRELIR